MLLSWLLILRELVLEDVRGQNPAEDPEVVPRVESSLQSGWSSLGWRLWPIQLVASETISFTSKSTLSRSSPVPDGRRRLPVAEE